MSLFGKDILALGFPCNRTRHSVLSLCLFISMMVSPATHAQESQLDEPIDQNRLYGLNFSPNFGALPHKQGMEAVPDELEQWLRIIAPYTHWIRTFDTDYRLENVGEIAHRLNLKAAVGAWLGPERDDTDRTANERSIAQLIAMGLLNQVDLAIVGSEVLFRGDLFPEQLLRYIQKVKEALPKIAVTTAETYSHLLDHPEILEVVDTVLMNHYAYWEGIRVEEAIPTLHSAYQDLVNASRGKPIIVSESGWPTCGETRGEAVPSLENARFYLAEFLSWAQANQVKYFYFEAFDEPWKIVAEGPQGACWGLWDKNGNLKPGLSMVINGEESQPLATDADLANAQPE